MQFAGQPIECRKLLSVGPGPGVPVSPMGIEDRDPQIERRRARSACLQTTPKGAAQDQAASIRAASQLVSVDQVSEFNRILEVKVNPDCDCTSRAVGAYRGR
jgi:hypothetical protein